MLTRNIVYGFEYLTIDENGHIGRPERGVAPSPSWRVTFAVTKNNFGKVVARWTLGRILDDPRSIPWKFKNGKQRTFILDDDHGTARLWTQPHRVY